MKRPPSPPCPGKVAAGGALSPRPDPGRGALRTREAQSSGSSRGRAGRRLRKRAEAAVRFSYRKRQFPPASGPHSAPPGTGPGGRPTPRRKHPGGHGGHNLPEVFPGLRKWGRCVAFRCRKCRPSPSTDGHRGPGRGVPAPGKRRLWAGRPTGKFGGFKYPGPAVSQRRATLSRPRPPATSAAASPAGPPA